MRDAPLTTIHYDFESIGVPELKFVDCKPVYFVQDAETRLFYSTTHDKFLEVSTGNYCGTELTCNRGIIDTFSGVVAITYDPNDCVVAERAAFDVVVGAELAKMLRKMQYE